MNNVKELILTSVISIIKYGKTFLKLLIEDIVN